MWKYFVFADAVMETLQLCAAIKKFDWVHFRSVSICCIEILPYGDFLYPLLHCPFCCIGRWKSTICGIEILPYGDLRVVPLLHYPFCCIGRWKYKSVPNFFDEERLHRKDVSQLRSFLFRYEKNILQKRCFWAFLHSTVSFC
jgi:hypothetical protein